jgi:uncharacterized protein (DUF1330 family)
VVIEFPTFATGVGCFASADYDRAAAFRRGGAGQVETVIIEGVPRRVSPDERARPPGEPA